jgi:CheY-like chemotaxis protein
MTKNDSACLELDTISDDWEQTRVSRLLLVGSMYDAHIFLDAGFRAPGVPSPGRREADLGPLPGCFMVTSGQQALELIAQEKLDLVFTDYQLSDMNGFELARKIKAIKADLPIIIVTGNNRFGLSGSVIPERKLVDRIFTWYGNPDLIDSMLQLVEDHANADKHILGKNVRCILLVEDEPNFFSHYLVMIHRELRERSLALIPENASAETRCKRIRQMPKLLLAETCEEADYLYQRYGDNMIGVISDLQFPHQGKINDRAGMKLTKDIKDRTPHMPVIIQSLQSDLEQEIIEAGAFFVKKDSETLLLQIRSLLLDYFGFGDFIFRMPDGHEVARAKNLRELVEHVKKVPLECFLYHGKVNHFSTWLYLHGRYELAEILRPIKGQTESLRKQMIAEIEPYLKNPGK